MTAKNHCAAGLLLGLALAPSVSTAHPHMFVDASSELTIDDSGRLTELRTFMVIDELTTLFVLEEYNLVLGAEPLSDEAQAEIAAGMVDGLGIYDFFTDLRVEGERQGFTDAAVTDVRIEDGKLAATLELTLETPQAVRGRDVELSLYDPTYFADVQTIEAPALPALDDACRVRLVKFQPSSLDATTLAALGALSREETPDDPRIGARFADRSYIACSG